jgi:hypothetical protein
MQKYQPAMIQFGMEHGKPGQVGHIVVRHDDWCPFLRGKDCSCSPEFEFHNQLPESFQAKKPKRKYRARGAK